MKNRICLPIILASCALACLTNSSSAEDKKVYDLATVVKISGINWFNYMETGVKKFGKDTGNKTVQLGPPTTDSAQQIQIVDDAEGDIVARELVHQRRNVHRCKRSRDAAVGSSAISRSRNAVSLSRRETRAKAFRCRLVESSGAMRTKNRCVEPPSSDSKSIPAT